MVIVIPYIAAYTLHLRMKTVLYAVVKLFFNCCMLGSIELSTNIVYVPFIAQIIVCSPLS